MEANFLTAVEIAKILKISKALAYRLIAQGQIPSIRFGKTVRVRAQDLDAFVQRNVIVQDSTQLTSTIPSRKP